MRAWAPTTHISILTLFGALQFPGTCCILFEKKENFFQINLKLLHPGLSEPFDWNSILFKNHFFSKNASLWKQFSVFYPSPLRLEFRTLSNPRQTNQKPDQEKIVEIFNPVIRWSVDPLIRWLWSDLEINVGEKLFFKPYLQMTFDRMTGRRKKSNAQFFCPGSVALHWSVRRQKPTLVLKWFDFRHRA